MRIASLSNRLVIVESTGEVDYAFDVAELSHGRFPSDAQSVYEDWDAFRAWAAEQQLDGGSAIDRTLLDAPAPRPRQVFAIGLNYSEHVAESGNTLLDNNLPVFTKFQSCITGPVTEVVLPPGGHTDWEVELVVVIGRRAVDVDVDDALDYVAGYSVGQDLSERILQSAATPRQFSLGKSFPGFGPIGPWLVTLDEFADPNDLELGCAINGEPVQTSRTSQLIFSVPRLIASLSTTLPLLPGDVIFTGTPSGVGLGRTPQRWLAAGDVLTSEIKGIGGLRQTFVD